MPTFNSTFRSSQVANLVTLESELENSLPARVALSYGPGSLQSTTSALDLFDQSFTISDDEVALCVVTFNYSASATTIGLNPTLRLDSTDIIYPSCSNIQAGVLNGNADAITLVHMAQNLSSGTHYLKARLAIFTGSGTVYSNYQWGYVLAFKRRA